MLFTPNKSGGYHTNCTPERGRGSTTWVYIAVEPISGFKLHLLQYPPNSLGVNNILPLRGNFMLS